MLGGGTFQTQNKLLVGSYINFVSAKDANPTMGDRGYVAVALDLDWGADGMVTITAESFQKDAQKIFGYDYTHEKVTPLREIFKNANTVYVYKLNANGAKKAANSIATAKYAGVRGNNLSIKVEANVDVTDAFDVSTYLEGRLVDKQTVKIYSELKSNDYVDFNISAGSLTSSDQPVQLIGGANGSQATGEDHSKFLAVAESYMFNILVCNSTTKAIVDLYTAYTKRMRDEVGVKFQTVVYGMAGEEEIKPNNKGLIVVDTPVISENIPAHYSIFWSAGAEAGCEIYNTITNKVYDGDYKLKNDYTKTELEAAIKGGKLVFHKVGDNTRVLVDINSLVEYDLTEGEDFSNNKTIRIIDQLGNDIAVEFNGMFLGKIPNDAAGRISLWNSIDKYCKELQKLRAIQDWDNSKLKVSEGEAKNSVVVEMEINIVGTMEKLYMTVQVV